MINEFQIECFMCVVKHHSFSAAAEEKYLSQPSISKHIKNLEINLGLHLFERKNNQFELTPFGDAMYKYFMMCYDEYGKIRERFFTNTGLKEEIHVAFLQGSDYFKWTKHSFEKFLADYPSYSISVSFHSFSALRKILFSQKRSCAIFPISLFNIDENLNYIELIKIKKCIYYPKKLFMNKKKPETLSDFSECTFTLTDEFKASDALNTFFDYHKFEIKPEIKIVADVDNMIWNVKYNSCVAIMDTAVISLEHDESIGSLCIDVDSTIALAWLKDNNDSAVERFIATISDYL